VSGAWLYKETFMSDSGGGEFLSDMRATDSYSKAWQMIFQTFWPLILITVLHVILRAPADSVEESFRGSIHVPGWYAFLAALYGVFVATPLSMGFAWVVLHAARGEEVRVRDLFSAFERNYGNAVVGGLLAALIVIGGMVLLVVPGFIFACRLAFVPFLIVDQRMGGTEAIRTSWRMTKGHGWTIFGMGLLALPIMIAGALALVVGIFVALLWVAGAFAVLFHSVGTREGIPK
jgi:uncharacterized membrane protein